MSEKSPGHQFAGEVFDRHRDPIARAIWEADQRDIYAEHGHLFEESDVFKTESKEE